MDKFDSLIDTVISVIVVVKESLGPKTQIKTPKNKVLKNITIGRFVFKSVLISLKIEYLEVNVATAARL
jgi:hypothetical protein